MNMRAGCRGSLANNGLEYNPMEEALGVLERKGNNKITYSDPRPFQLGFGTTFGYLWWYGK